MNNNTQLHLIAQVFVLNKTTKSYTWILECTKKATIAKLVVFITNANFAANVQFVKYTKYLTNSLYFSH